MMSSLTILSLFQTVDRKVCSSNPCQNSGTCLNLHDSFFCICPSQWKVSHWVFGQKWWWVSLCGFLGIVQTYLILHAKFLGFCGLPNQNELHHICQTPNNGGHDCITHRMLSRLKEGFTWLGNYMEGYDISASISLNCSVWRVPNESWHSHVNFLAVFY